MKYAFTAATLAASLGLAAAVTIKAAQSASFVKTSGQQFTLDGQKFTVVGSNAYWIPQLSNNRDITTAFNDIKNAGSTTLRTWGFNEVTSRSGTYYQIWKGRTSTLNTGADGLGRFDTVVAQAKAFDIRLIVALTNNWKGVLLIIVLVLQRLMTSHRIWGHGRLRPATPWNRQA
ncbi:hypothetical protein RSAG8_02505, partial [Rhizoctonia solani AG-8 WAC10335]